MVFALFACDLKKIYYLENASMESCQLCSVFAHLHNATCVYVQNRYVKLWG